MRCGIDAAIAGGSADDSGAVGGRVSGISISMKYGCIIPNLLVGPAPMDDADFQQLKALGITAILSFQTDEDGPEGAIEDERRAVIKAGMSFTHLPITDFDRLELARRLPECVTALE